MYICVQNSSSIIESTNTLVIVLSIVGASLVILVLIGIVVGCYLRSQRSKEDQHNTDTALAASDYGRISDVVSNEYSVAPPAKIQQYG